MPRLSYHPRPQRRVSDSDRPWLERPDRRRCLSRCFQGWAPRCGGARRACRCRAISASSAAPACLPARALAHAEAILDHEIEALIPLQSRQILSDWFIREEDLETGALHGMQVILSRARLAEPKEALRKAGPRITHLTVDDGEGAPLPVDLVANPGTATLSTVPLVRNKPRLRRPPSRRFP